MLDWDDLRHFLALADDGSLSAAARRLRVEHATVARRVAALESATGVKLVDRRAGRYVLTPDGRRVADYARRMESEAFSIERLLRAAQNDLAAEMTITAPPLIASHLIAPRIALLRRDHPNLRLRLLGDSRTLSLPRREADIALRLNRPDDAALMIRKIGSMTYRLYGSATYLKKRAKADYEFIAFDESLDHVPQQSWLNGLLAGRPVVLRSNDLAVQHAAALAGVGIAALPDFLGTSTGLRQADPAHGVTTRDVWLTYHEDMRDSPGIPVLTDFLAGCLAQEKPARRRARAA
ncbi:LysR family transcriptional regulator [Ferrovibrio sp.]|uniref:LysR family transcriptional regulator n=1 Tax=Ferrovibrio sp. TaxID=1917215 RepID=UPI0035B0ED95